MWWSRQKILDSCLIAPCLWIVKSSLKAAWLGEGSSAIFLYPLLELMIRWPSQRWTHSLESEWECSEGWIAHSWLFFPSEGTYVKGGILPGELGPAAGFANLWITCSSLSFQAARLVSSLGIYRQFPTCIIKNYDKHIQFSNLAWPGLCWTI